MAAPASAASAVTTDASIVKRFSAGASAAISITTSALARAAPAVPTGVDPGPRPSRREPVRSAKVERNEPCPCGSGKKFKKCCGSVAPTVH
ncbi:MAG: hypothetical protein EHM67_15050 [Hyphomicrobiaceae bacterium]|nr:MAG: hypothetical protein EHM67_15050 [Hyphomicrobiaceae bacterium]